MLNFFHEEQKQKKKRLKINVHLQYTLHMRLFIVSGAVCILISFFDRYEIILDKHYFILFSERDGVNENKSSII